MLSEKYGIKMRRERLEALSRLGVSWKISRPVVQTRRSGGA
jgi:hypothetical protein